jgi:hypothetical protein
MVDGEAFDAKVRLRSYSQSKLDVTFEGSTASDSNTHLTLWQVFVP